MNCVIVDDELSARTTLNAFLEKYCPDLTVVGMAEGVAEAAKLIEQTLPDLIFLDIQMPGENGFQLLSQLPEYDFSLIFTTAYDQYALRALKLGALDYLLKPIDLLDLQEAVAKARKHKDLNGNQKRLEYLREGQDRQEKLVVSSMDGYYVLRFDEIIRFEAERNYTRIVLNNNRQLIASKTLKFFADMLPSERFFRVHKSYLINLDEVVRVSRGQVGSVEMSDGEEVEFSKGRKPQLMELLRTQARNSE